MSESPIAAQAAGTYTFDTIGSALDTLIYVLDGDCAGAELACNDDAVGLASSVTVNLAANQTVIVVLDAYAGSGGDYVLNISQ